MFFFIKPSVLHVDCFTSRADVYECFPIAKSIDYIPSWWKKLPKEIIDENFSCPQPTLKTCFGFIDFYSSGFTIPLWSDLYLQVGENSSFHWQYADGNSIVDSHPLSIQSPGFLDPGEWFNLKLFSPWYFKAKEKFCYVGNIWNMKNPDEVLVAPGIMEFQNQHSTNINLFFRNIPNRKILLEANTPLVNIIPMSDKKVKIHNHLITNEEHARFERRNFFINTLKKTKKVKDNQRKCPFSH